jgi:hypothetical protein
VNEKQKIRVIKKSAIQQDVPLKDKPERAAAGKIVSTVANWVSDLRRRKNSERKAAVEKFFALLPKPN